MDKFDAAGLEVSAKVLVVALQTDGQLRASAFPNTAAGHKQLVRDLRHYSRRLRIWLESTGLYGLDVALALQAQERLGAWLTHPHSVGPFAQHTNKPSETGTLTADFQD